MTFTRTDVRIGVRDCFARDALVDLQIEEQRGGRVFVTCIATSSGPGQYLRIYSWLYDHAPVGIEFRVVILHPSEVGR